MNAGPMGDKYCMIGICIGSQQHVLYNQSQSSKREQLLVRSETKGKQSEASHSLALSCTLLFYF